MDLDFGRGSVGGRLAADVAGRGTEAEGIGTSIDDPGALGLIEGGEVGGREGQGNLLALTRLQATGLGIGLQFLDRLVEAALRSGDIELDGFLALDGTGVLHGHGRGDGLAVKGVGYGMAGHGYCPDSTTCQ